MKNYLRIIGVFILASVMNVNAAQTIKIKAPDVIPIFKEETKLVLSLIHICGVPKHLVKTLTRAKFEALAHNLIQACFEPCKKAMSDAGLNNADIDEVILVGGS